MMSKTKKQIYWIIGGCLSLCILIFYQFFLTFLADWFLQAYSFSKLGKPLHYEKIYLDGNRIVVIRPRFEDEPIFTAEQMTLHFCYQFWKSQLHVEVEIEQPHFHFQTPEALQWSKLLKLLSQEKRWITIHPYFHIKGGLLSWVFKDYPYQHQLNYDLEMNNQEGGYIKFYFDSLDSKSNVLLLQASKLDSGMEINCSWEKVGCPCFVAFTQFLGIDFFPWAITSGSLQGQLKAVFPGTKRPYLEGNLIVENLVFSRFQGALKGQIGLAHFQLEKNQIAYELNNQLPTIVGRLDIIEPASLSYLSPSQEWNMQQIKGSVQLNGFETALIDFWAQGGNDYYSSQWNLKGKANLNAQRSFDLDVTLSCFMEGQPDGKIHLALNQIQEGAKHTKIHCERLSYIECEFLQNLLAIYWPVFNEVLIQDGELNALIEADVMPQGIGELYIKQFEVFHLRSKLRPWNMTCDFGQIRGYGKVHLGREDFWQSVNAGLHLEDGQIEFEDLTPLLPMTDIQAHLFIQQGHVEHSLVTLQVAGLKGKMNIEWGEYQQFLNFKLDGIVQDLADLFPNILQEGLRKHFYHNRLVVLANLKRQDQQVSLDGTLHVQRTNTDCMDLIHFGCELKKIQNSLEVKYVPVGWFHAQRLPLEKFLSPFIFRNEILKMSGEIELEGSFDDQFLVIKYDADDLKIENENLCITIPHLHSPISGQFVGLHQFDLCTYAYQGSLPIQSASYFEKNTGLVFHDIQGLATFKNDFISICPIETCCEGIYFAGKMELDYSDPAPGVFNTTIHCPNLSGKVSQVQSLLAHLNQPSLLHKISLEGEITGKKEGLKLKFFFKNQDYDVEADVQGAITEGALSFDGTDMALRGIYMDVNYHHPGQCLEFSDIQGTFLVGKPRRVNEYLFIGHHIYFNQISHPNIDLDIAIKDQEYELLRLVGYTSGEAETKNLHLNQDLSHISSIYPHIWQCQLKNWSTIEKLEFYSQFDLGNFLRDLQRCGQTGLLLSPRITDKISQFLPIEGKTSLTLHYHPDQSYTYCLESTIKYGDFSEHFSLLKGSKRDKKWIIDQFQYDDWNIYAELQQMEGRWRIPFLGLKVGQTLLLGLEGDWLPDLALLRAKLKFCEADLSKLNRFVDLQNFVFKWQPKGTLKATGEFEWNLFASSPIDGCKASLSAEVCHFTLRDYPFNISQAFQVRLESGCHLYLENIQLELAPQRQAYIHLKQLECEPMKELISSVEADFQLPCCQLGKIESLHQYFSDIFNSKIKEFLLTAKQRGQWKGVLIFNHSNPDLLQVKLEDGVFTLKKREYECKQVQLKISGNELRFSALSQQERCPFQIIGQVEWPSCKLGQLKLINKEANNPLVIKWENQAEKGLAIQSLQGEFNGCSFFLKKDTESLQNSNWVALQGQVIVDFNRLSSLLTMDIAETIRKLDIGSTYSFVGRFWTDPDWEKSLLEAVSFKGKLRSEEAILKGYHIHSLQADMQYIPGRLDIQDLFIQDSAGSIKADDGVIILDKNQNQWNFSLPRLTVKNLRVSLLREKEDRIRNNRRFRSLILKKIEFQDLKGNLSDIQTWEAQGNLHFLNPSRKIPFHPLLAIPAEIILRLGLDPHVFNPVTGTIYFYLQNERFYLTRFKDVYSEGRGSKFYLAQRGSHSWMDFNGNLSINIRMKQYNLIFKIAELFTVSIQGNIKKPRYSLQKQSKTSHRGHEMSMNLSP